MSSRKPAGSMPSTTTASVICRVVSSRMRCVPYWISSSWPAGSLWPKASCTKSRIAVSIALTISASRSASGSLVRPCNSSPLSRWINRISVTRNGSTSRSISSASGTPVSRARRRRNRVAGPMVARMRTSIVRARSRIASATARPINCAMIGYSASIISARSSWILRRITSPRTGVMAVTSAGSSPVRRSRSATRRARSSARRRSGSLRMPRSSSRAGS
ncbi:MAG: hypothetical protein BWY52_02370 [Chloroflexi bacterium ADurb.Bin325]|nr:MAG: hypothetical protein BWY52_02370 [Chloroflexi bacterium ADurb.Bin325]